MKKLRTKIYKCYEIVVLDEDDNEVGSPDYCYGNREQAEELAKYKLSLIEDERREE